MCSHRQTRWCQHSQYSRVFSYTAGPAITASLFGSSHLQRSPENWGILGSCSGSQSREVTKARPCLLSWLLLALVCNFITSNITMKTAIFSPVWPFARTLQWSNPWDEDRTSGNFFTETQMSAWIWGMNWNQFFKVANQGHCDLFD